MSFSRLFELADERSDRTAVIAAGGADLTVLEALSQAERRGWVRPIVTGDATEIRRLAEQWQLDVSRFEILESSEPAAQAVAEVVAGRAALLMKGQISTPELMKAVLARGTGLRTSRVIGQVVLMEICRDNRRFLLTDTGITIQPSLEQKADLLRSLVSVAGALREPGSPERPKVAIMAASEKATEAMPDTLEAAELRQRHERGEFPECHVQGPLSFDLAYASEAGGKKRLEGSVIGAADAMLFPSLQAANLTVKAMMYTADCQFGGVLVGTAAPVVFMSRADTTATRLNSLAFTLQYLRSQQSAR